MSEERKCPSCGVEMRRITLERLQEIGMAGNRCLDRECPPFKTWPEVADGAS